MCQVTFCKLDAVKPHRHTPVVMPHRHVPLAYPIVTHSWSCLVVMFHCHIPSSHTRGHVPSSYPIDTPYRVSSCLVVTSHRHPPSTPSPCPIVIAYRHVSSSYPIVTPYQHVPSSRQTVTSHQYVTPSSASPLPLLDLIITLPFGTSLSYFIVKTHRHIVTPIVCFIFCECVLVLVL